MSSIFPVEDFKHRRTPFYYYDLELLRATLDAVSASSDYPGFKVHYAVKANVNSEILNTISARGFGADTVSGGEIKKAVECGFNPADIVFAGVGKSDEEIDYAINTGIGCFNVESEAELDVIAQIASHKGVCVNVALRVNPDIDAHTHHYITTGLSENKFGIDMSMLRSIVDKCMEYDSIKLCGLHFHIGSQITTMDPYRLLCKRINLLQDEYESIGVRFSTINVGGGLGVDYDNPDSNPIPDFESYFNIFKSELNIRKGQEVHFELGRSIVAQCGSLISRVLYVKQGVNKRFVIVDAGFTDLIRPALYQAHHLIQNITSHQTDKMIHYDVVGPICESSDTFGQDVELPLTNRGDMIAFRSAGAYGEIMAMQYNCRRLPGYVAI